MATNAVQYSSAEFGAIYYHDGIIWAGNRNLVFSEDSGKTWNTSSLPVVGPPITAISFFTKDTGVVCTLDTGIFRTYDRGRTWTTVTSSAVISDISYGNSSSSIFATSWNNPGGVLSSTNGGQSWGLSYSAYLASGLAVDMNGTIYADGAYNNVFVISSTDQGSSWKSSVATFDLDSYSLAVDQCDPSWLYIANENYYLPGDGNSKLYYSSNSGVTWGAGFSHVGHYLSGSISVSAHALYAQTLSNGILRSTDHGASWVNIGGPSQYADSRDVFAINDNIIFAIDAEGSIWATFNSGGDSLTFSGPTYLTALPTSLFTSDTICDSLIDTVFISRSCPSPSITGWSIVGQNSSSYMASYLSFNSILVTLHAKNKGIQNAKLVIHIDNGSNDTVSFAGYTKANTFKASPDTAFTSDTITTCDSLSRPVVFNKVGCNPPSVSGWSIIGHDRASYSASIFSNDSILVTLNGTNHGKQNAKLVLRLNNGSNDTVSLAGNVTPNVLVLLPKHCSHPIRSAATVLLAQFYLAELAASLLLSRGGRSSALITQVLGRAILPIILSKSLCMARSKGIKVRSYSSILITARTIPLLLPDTSTFFQMH